MRFYTILIILISTVFTVFGQQTDIESKIDLITKEVEAVIKEKNIPAVSIALVVNNDEVHYLNFGHFDRTQEKAVNEESLYQIASLGKSLIGIITHNLVLEGKLRLDQPITDFLSKDLHKKTFKKLNKITILHLLHHKSGLPGNAKVSYRRKDGDPYRYNYTEQDLLKELKKVRLRSLEKRRYSNLGYALLAYLLEEATKSTFDELLTKYIKTPYQLEATDLNLSQAAQNKVVRPYRKDDRMVETKPWLMGKLGPPSAIYSSTKDLSKLLVAQIRAYQDFDSNKTPHPLMLNPDKKSNSRYGYGFNNYGNISYGHAGDMDSYACDYSITPEKNYGIVLLSSSGEHWINPLIRKINRILGQ